jgi:hypothetical protein
MAQRRDFPLDHRKPVSHVRYTYGLVTIIASADGVKLDNGFDRKLTPTESDRLALLLHRASMNAALLREGMGPTTSEPTFIDMEKRRVV